MALSTISANTKITAATLNGVINAVNSLQSANPKASITATYTSGTNWYRKWSDGWIEQGGQNDVASGGSTITLHVPFSNTSYTVVSSASRGGAVSGSFLEVSSASAFLTGVTFRTGGTQGDVAGRVIWYACRILTFHSKRTQFSEKEIAQNERIFYWSNFFGRIPS